MQRGQNAELLTVISVGAYSYHWALTKLACSVFSDFVDRPDDKAARTSETSINIQLRTRQYIPEDSELNTRRRENLKSHNDFVISHHVL
jgi:hypothetical protein